MLRWIAYIKSLNPEIRHISKKDNVIGDMLSRARFDDEDGMISEDEEVGVDFFESAQITARGRSTPAVNEFNEDEYEGELLPPWTRYGPRRKQTKSERRCTGSSYGMGAPEKA